MKKYSIILLGLLTCATFITLDAKNVRKSQNCNNGNCAFTEIDCAKCCNSKTGITPECCRACNNCKVHGDLGSQECGFTP